MLSLVVAVLVASLLGSVHCVGMCGPLALMAGHSSGSGSGSCSRVAVYHAGRIFAYAILGLVVGLLGSGLQQTGTWLGLQRLAAQLAGGSMLVIGLWTMVGLMQGQTLHMPLPVFVQRLVQQAHRWSVRLPPLRRAWSIGMVTALLPCGWLYSFLLVAAGTAAPLQGATVMVFFGLGSVPALATVVASAQWMIRRAAGSWSRWIPWLGACLIVLVGVSTLVQRSQTDLGPLAGSQLKVGSLLEQVQAIDTESLPCCKAK
jgi:hypothetical protein